MHILIVLVVCALLFAAASLLALYSYGRFAARARGAPSGVLPADGAATGLDRAVVPMIREHEGETGAALLSDNLGAFAMRAHTARSAGRSLDLMYYYWKDDLTGGLLAREVLAAADRGVRVRVLLDDISTRGDGAYLALDSHPNVELRLFNPARARTNPVRRGIDLLLRAASATRRMHNKAWIADGRVAIVGGRNIGDAYFNASQITNFRDMDLLLLGPAVDQAGAVFDAFWNSGAALPVRRLSARRADLPRFRKALEAFVSRARAEPYLRRLREARDAASILADEPRLHWIANVAVLSDPPEKADGTDHENWLGGVILPLIAGAARSVQIVSPYFIPGDAGVETLAGLRERGIDVMVLTNSLAATDVAAVHGAYARYRPPLLAGGVRLFELRPEALGDRSISLFGSKGASLHTKAFAVDRRWGFVGSFNFDPRSISLNTEMGVLFDSTALTEELIGVIAGQIDARESYRLFVRDGRIAWEDGAAADARIWRREPEAGFWRRLIAAVIGWLPIESQL